MARTAGSHAEQTGPRIRAAALRLIAQHGYAAVSMRQIAAEVGVQAGALYSYIPDKQALLFDLMRTHMEDVLSALDAESISGSPVEQLERFTRFHIRYHQERSNEIFVAYMELRNLTEDNFAAIEELRRGYEQRLQSILEAGQQRGEFQVPDARLATMAVIAMLNGVTVWFREGGRLSIDRVERIYWNMIRRAVKG